MLLEINDNLSINTDEICLIAKTTVPGHYYLTVIFKNGRDWCIDDTDENVIDTLYKKLKHAS